MKKEQKEPAAGDYIEGAGWRGRVVDIRIREYAGRKGVACAWIRTAHEQQGYIPLDEITKHEEK